MTVIWKEYQNDHYSTNSKYSGHFGSENWAQHNLWNDLKLSLLSKSNLLKTMVTSNYDDKCVISVKSVKNRTVFCFDCNYRRRLHKSNILHEMHSNGCTLSCVKVPCLKVTHFLNFLEILKKYEKNLLSPPDHFESACILFFIEI